MATQGESATVPEATPRGPSQGNPVSRLKRIRGGYRAHVTKTFSEARILLEEEVSTVLNVDKILTKLKDKEKLLSEIDKEIFLLISEDEVEREVIDCEDLKSEIQSFVIELEARKFEISTSNYGSQNAQAASPSPSFASSDMPKLPKLQLPKFSGDPKKWQEWWDSFQVIHENTSLSDVNKFRHLKTLLEGPAATAISGIQPTNANYREAVELLQTRFAQRQLIINAHMEVLLNLKQVSSERDVRGLRKLYDTIETNTRSLKTLGVDFQHYGALLIPVIMSKIPEDIRFAITKSQGKDEWVLDKLLETFQTELEVREQCSVKLDTTYSPSSHGFAPRPARNSMPTAAALLNNGGKVTCTFCKGSHPSARCTVVSEPNARKNVLSKQGRCFVCLKRGHLSRNCSSQIHCFVCRQRHHASICTAQRNTPGQFDTPEAQPERNSNISGNSQLHRIQSTPTAQQRDNIGQSTVSMYVDSRGSVLLQTAKGFISSVNRANYHKIARMIFDSGSQRSYITKELKDCLGLPTIRKETLEITLFGSEQGKVETLDVTQFCVRSPYNDLSVYVTAYVVPKVSAPLTNQAINFASTTYPHLSGLMLADYPATADDKLLLHILIGSDYYWQFMTGRTARGEQGGPIGLESTLGWILSGPIPNCPEVSKTQTNLTQTHLLRISAEVKQENSKEKTLETELSKFWDLETLGISPTEESLYENFSQEISFSEGRYEVKLPWKANHPLLPDNYALSKRRLDGQFRKLKASPDLLNEYDAIIKLQEEQGIIERVMPTEESEAGKTHYLPHHPVVRKDKTTTKVRVVYDASAANSTGISLNSCLYPGPCLLKTVAEILIRFRANPIALIADIEKAFLMIAVHKNDRDVLRFLWYQDVNETDLEQVTYRFCRVVFGVTCSPFLLNVTLKHHIEKYANEHPEVCSKLISSLYADDVSTGGHSIEESFKFYEISKEIMKQGGFNLRKWHSNSEELTERIAEFEKQQQCKETDKEVVLEEDESFAKTTISEPFAQRNTQQKILGLNWDSQEDKLIFDFSQLVAVSKNVSVTKRSVLSLIAKIFDPLGLISPITSMLKVFIQKLFRLKLSWDEILPDNLFNEWTAMMSELTKVHLIAVPRYYFGIIQSKPTKIELFGFCDASSIAFAALVYAKITSCGQSSIQLVCSKTRVAPLAKHSIPRLELLSCLILARLISTVQKSFSPLFNVDIMQCWTDSLAAKYWIKGVSRYWKLFVENRVQEIRKLVDPQLWSHCPGSQNPADIPTREMNVEQFKQNTIWWHGPKWLLGTEREWPNSSISDTLPQECLDEMKHPQRTEKTAVLKTTVTAPSIRNFIDYDRFSDYQKLLRVAAYVLRFIRNCRNKVRGNQEELSVDEINDAEIIIIREARGSFDEDHLQKIENTLGTFVDSNMLIRCEGRLKNSSLPFDSRHPILMPRHHKITSLLILSCHDKVMHNGTKETLAELRSRFWIIKGRQVVKMILRKCVNCKRIQGLSYGAPSQSQLPEFRVQEKHAFSSVGIDFAGPLYIKSSSSPSRKVYLALFTCGISRAVHLEVVPDLSTSAFLRCFKRFVSRRGTPSIIVTDNAKTFKAASKQLQAILKSAEVRTYCNSRRIKWYFNLAKAPWCGGFYERLIRGFKSCLKKCIGLARLTYDEVSTVVTEIEAIFNSRPLTYLYENELEEALTPSHLLVGRRLLSLSETPQEEDDDGGYGEQEDVARRRQRYLNKVLDNYWRRWKREYLVDLREYHRLEIKRSHVPEISEGDIVSIEDENRKNRATWKLGKVEAVKKGQDEVIRGARVRLANGNFIDRPIQKLYPIEVNQRRTLTEVKDEGHKTDERPKRKAAMIARERIDIIDQLDDLM